MVETRTFGIYVGEWNHSRASERWCEMDFETILSNSERCSKAILIHVRVAPKANRPFDILVSPFWFISSHGPNRLACSFVGP